MLLHIRNLLFNGISFNGFSIMVWFETVFINHALSNGSNPSSTLHSSNNVFHLNFIVTLATFQVNDVTALPFIREFTDKFEMEEALFQAHSGTELAKLVLLNIPRKPFANRSYSGIFQCDTTLRSIPEESAPFGHAFCAHSRPAAEPPQDWSAESVQWQRGEIKTHFWNNICSFTDAYIQ